MGEEKETLWDLYFGIVALSILIGAIGAAIAEEKLAFAMGVCYGGAVAAILVTHMYQSLGKTLDYDEEGARKHAQKMAGIRMWIMLAAVGIALYFGAYLHIAGVVLGILTLKASAYAQPVVHRRITSKIYKKGR